jgi:hypothetical protein
MLWQGLRREPFENATTLKGAGLGPHKKSPKRSFTCGGKELNEALSPVQLSQYDDIYCYETEVPYCCYNTVLSLDRQLIDATSLAASSAMVRCVT